jgi:hypothetical protein
MNNKRKMKKKKKKKLGLVVNAYDPMQEDCGPGPPGKNGSP